jgi:hypothetical protein
MEKLGSGMEKFGSGMEKFGSGIWDKHPRSATLPVILLLDYQLVGFVLSCKTEITAHKRLIQLFRSRAGQDWSLLFRASFPLTLYPIVVVSVLDF